MLRSLISSTAIINSHQIIFAALRIRLQATIQEDDRNVSSVKSGHNSLVCFVSIVAKLNRSEKYAGHFSSDVMPAQHFSRFVFFLVLRYGISPKQRVVHGL